MEITVKPGESITIIYTDSDGNKQEIYFDSVNSLILALTEDLRKLELHRKKATSKKEERRLYRSELLILKSLLNLKRDHFGIIEYR